jgi:MFS family permease
MAPVARPGPLPPHDGRRPDAPDDGTGPAAFLPAQDPGPLPEDPTARIPREVPDGEADVPQPPRPGPPRIPRKLTVTRVAAYRGRQFGGWATYMFRRAATADGADRSGLTALTYATMVTYALDAAVAVALANTLFFAAATAESKTNVALYLAITVAPFAVIAPVIGPLLDRMQRGRRIAMAVSCAGRAVLAVVMALNYDNWILYPAALGAMVLSKSFLVLKAAVTPRVLPPTITLATTNSRLTTFGMVAGGVAGAVAAGVSLPFGSAGALYWTAALGVVGTVLSMRIPRWVESTSGEVAASMRSSRRDRAPVSRAVLVALWGTSAVRVLTGFLTLFVAFVVKYASEQAGGDPAQQLYLIGIVGAAAGAGLFLGNAVGTRIRFGGSGVVVLACAAVAVAAAVLAAFLPGIPTAALAALVASTASAMAKVCLDAVIQRDLPEHARASAFGRSETWLQLAWVLGGALGVLLPHSTFWIGFAVVAGVVALFGLQAAAVLRGGTLVPGLGARELPTRRPVGATRSP